METPRGQGIKTAHAVQTTVAPRMSEDENPAFAVATAVLGFTADQVQRILSLMKELKDGYEKLTGKNS